jgi:alkanesulfonate monooxygenase SsuD/methylene tetrahydromethanopterin reductase-like flavin-dependent oxidoreductase (luciferase family)
MDIGYVMAIRYHPNHAESLEGIYSDFIDEAIYAEQLGFDYVWTGEHHFKEDAWCPSPLHVLTAIAARTSLIKIGTFILVLPLHHPVNVAEDAAVVDLLSGGRFNLGVGVGGAGSDVESQTFGIPPEKMMTRMYEGLEIIKRCFTEDSFDYEGKAFHFHDVKMTTKPAQKPYPPIWVASFGPKSVARAAAEGYNSLAGSRPGFAPDYYKMARAAGHNPEAIQVSTGPIWIHLANTWEQAWDEAEEGMHWTFEFYRRAMGNPMIPPTPPIGKLRHNTSLPGPFAHSMIVGTPNDALEVLERYRGSGVTQIALDFHHPGQPTEQVRRSMELFTENVMPALRTF